MSSRSGEAVLWAKLINSCQLLMYHGEWCQNVENNRKLLFIVTFKFYKNVSLSVMIRVIAVIAYNISIGIWNQLIPSATVDKHMLYNLQTII